MFFDFSFLKAIKYRLFGFFLLLEGEAVVLQWQGKYRTEEAGQPLMPLWPPPNWHSAREQGCPVLCHPEV